MIRRERTAHESQAAAQNETRGRTSLMDLLRACVLNLTEERDQSQNSESPPPFCLCLSSGCRGGTKTSRSTEAADVALRKPAFTRQVRHGEEVQTRSSLRGGGGATSCLLCNPPPPRLLLLMLRLTSCRSRRQGMFTIRSVTEGWRGGERRAGMKRSQNKSQNIAGAPPPVMVPNASGGGCHLNVLFCQRFR